MDSPWKQRYTAHAELSNRGAFLQGRFIERNPFPERSTPLTLVVVWGGNLDLPSTCSIVIAFRTSAEGAVEVIDTFTFSTFENAIVAASGIERFLLNTRVIFSRKTE